MNIKCFDENLKNVKLSNEAKEYYINKAKELYGKDLDNILIKFVAENKAEIYNIPDDVWNDMFYKEKFERIRRITGYLSSLDRFNNGKKGELRDRVKHM